MAPVSSAQGLASGAKGKNAMCNVCFVETVQVLDKLSLSMSYSDFGLCQWTNNMYWIGVSTKTHIKESYMLTSDKIVWPEVLKNLTLYFH